MTTAKNTQNPGLRPEKFQEYTNEIKKGLQEGYDHADDMTVKQQYQEAISSLQSTEKLVDKAIKNWK